MNPLNASEYREEHGAVARFVGDAFIEVIPLPSVHDQLALVPDGASLTVTCSSKLGLDRTLEVTALAAQRGHRVVPHVAARLVASEAELREFVARLDELGVTDLYVIGGDTTEPAGPYAHAAELVEALPRFRHGITTVGVACYPEGHPGIPDAVLDEALRRVQPLAAYMVSQLCFDAGAITGWLHRVRWEGIALPLHLGLAAPLQLRKLAELSLRIGVGSSVRYLTKQHGFVGKVLRGSAYRPEELLEQLGGALTDDDLAIERLHLFTFNQIAETLAWQARITG